MIKANNINYIHRQFSILKNINVSVENGEFLAIVGPNGAGKSSLLSFLANEIKVQENGIINFKEINISHWDVKELSQHKAKFSQHSSADISLPVQDVVMMGRYPYFKNQPQEVDFLAIKKVMQNVEIWHLKDRLYNSLSGGEKQRVHLSRVLSQLQNDIKQKIIFLDEPLNNLDVKYQYRTLDLIKSFTSQDNSAMVVLHDLNLAAQYADKILLMKNGEVSAFGTVEEVLTSHNISKAYGFPCQIFPHPKGHHPMIIFG